jgi:20S proteasome alpha/beta subunit
MTIVCAIKCNNGIVVGSDGQASVNTTGGAIRHQIQKIYQIGDSTVFLASGTIGLIQKSMEIVNNYSKELDSGFNADTLEAIKKGIFPIVKSARDTYVQYNNRTEGIPTVDILLCRFDKERKLRMWHMGTDTHDEFIDVVGCYCSGNGETFGYSLLKSLMQSSSNITSGKLIIYRTLRDTINSLAVGVGEPIDIWYIQDTGIIHKLSNEEIEDLSKSYKNWKEMEANFLSGRLVDLTTKP